MALKESLNSHEVTVAWNCLTGIRRQAEYLEEYLNESTDGLVDIEYMQGELRELLTAVKVQYRILETGDLK